MKSVKISSKWLQHRFNCTVENILTMCHGRCCEGTNQIVVSLLLEEQEWHRGKGYDVIDGLLMPDSRTDKCPHKEANGLCALHGTPYKPFGCIASPFTINKNDTLIIRHRYTHLKCHGVGLPAYVTFRASLNLLFGYNTAENITSSLNGDSGDFFVHMDDNVYRKLLYLDGLKHSS